MSSSELPLPVSVGRRSDPNWRRSAYGTCSVSSSGILLRDSDDPVFFGPCLRVR